MGRGGRRSLCSGLDSCTPLQGLITRVSLEIPRRPGPLEGGGLLGRASLRAAASAGASANHHRHQRFYWKEFIWRVYQGWASVYFSPGSRRSGGIALQTCCCLQRCEGDSVHEFPLGAGRAWGDAGHIAFINDLISGVQPSAALFSPLSPHRTGQKKNLFLLSPGTLEYVKSIRV